MNTLALFLGFVLGAAMGTVATASTAEELQDEAKRWLFKRRWQIYLRRRTWQFPFVLSRILRLLQIEILFLLICIWVLGLLWTIFFSPAWYEKSYTLYIIGTLVGVATAPWIWLHFSRHLSPDDSTDSQFARYQFMTFMLGAALLLTMVQPYLGSWLTRANKIEGFGVALNFTQQRSERGTNILQAGQRAGSALGATTSHLSNATTWAHRVATGHLDGEPGLLRRTLADIKPDMQGFSDLSVMDRDRVYIAYLTYEREIQRGESLPQGIQNLKDYVDKAPFEKRLKDDHDKDRKFLDAFSKLSECVALYARNMRDFRLFLIDTGPFVRSLMVNIASQWSERTDKRPAHSLRRSDTPKDADDLKTAADKLAEQVKKALNHSHDKIARDVCTDSKSPIPNLPLSATDLEGVGNTPYPAYFIAHYLAAIDSVESGVLISRDWLYFQKRQAKNEQFVAADDPVQGWYAVRAMLTASQLPYRFGSVFPTHRASVQFQQFTTDLIAALIGVKDALTWRAFCKHLATPGLHSLVGRYLAFTYADERNYLFELLRPEDFGLPLPAENALKSTSLSPATYLNEAEAILESSDCFADVPRFNQKFIGLYHLNAAQLRYSLRLGTSSDERPALTRKIRVDLELAKQLDFDPVRPDVLDLLRQGDEFEPHRTRLAEFRKVLDSEGDKD